MRKGKQPVQSTPQPPVCDLVVLVADMDTEFTVRGLLSRPDALAIRPITYSMICHPDRDSGCYRGCADALRPLVNKFRHALVMFDHHGCGQEKLSRTELEAETENQLRRSGWEDRAAVVVIDPELEIWVWSDSPLVDDVLGWKGPPMALRTWLRNEGHTVSLNAKPAEPKSAFRQALRQIRKASSASLFQQLAQQVSLPRCTDVAFWKWRSTLSNWFPRPCSPSPES
ncbi:MAG: methylation-associated defense system protein MAD4 [Gemmataceae bacterium]